MSAEDNLSPHQFGFKVGDPVGWLEAISKHSEGGGQPGRIDPNTELHTGQSGMSQEIVDHYAARPRARADHQVEIYHHAGKVWAGDGHHRIAAARVKGQQSMRVVHYGRES